MNKTCVNCAVNSYTMVDFDLSHNKNIYCYESRCKGCLAGSLWYPENTVPENDPERVK
jgi:hypothetical protein